MVVMLLKRSFNKGARSLKPQAAAAMMEDAKEDNAGSVLGDSAIASVCTSITR
jgi:hypothetical protein